MFIPFGEFAPDQPALGSGGDDNLNGLSVYGCVPRTAKSYGPFNDFSSVSLALSARCQGAISVRASDGTIHNFAGDATKLYHLNADGVTWDNVSKVGGYSTPADAKWYFVQMGNRIIATNYFDAIQTFVIGTSALFADLSAGAPKARYIAVIKTFLVAADTWDAVSGYVQNRVWWSDANDPTNWPTIGTAAAAAAQSDYQDIQNGGQITGLVGGVGGRDGAVFLQRGIAGMDYVGGGIVFSFPEVERNRGTTIPGSIINVGPFAGYLGEDGFFLFDGARSVPIGAGKVDRNIWDSNGIFAIDQTQIVRVCAAYDAKQKLIYWGIPISGGNGVLSLILVYNWDLNRWGCGGTAFTIEFLYTAYSPGYTLEGLDSISTSLDALPYSLDSIAWQGGRPQLAGFNSTTHKFGFFNGSSIGANMSTIEFPLGSERRIFIRGARPVTDATSATATVAYRDTQSALYSTSNTATTDADGKLHFRVSARYARVKIGISAGVSWTHAQGIDVDYIEEGAR